MSEADIFIVGGGPAGLAAAIVARSKGIRVTVADQARPPIDKACGEGLMPDTVTALAGLGVGFAPGEAQAFRGIRFLTGALGAVCVEAAFPDGAGLGVRRTILHGKLAQRAVEMGATLKWGARVTDEGAEAFCCDGQRVESRWIVGADGEGSRVRRCVAPGAARYERVRYGCRQHFQVRPWTDFVEVYWSRNCQAVVTPVGPEEVGVAVTSRDPNIRLESAMHELPVLRQHLIGAGELSRARGARCALRRLKAVQRGRFALIGDASGSVDPLTGEGLGLAFRQAYALIDALGANRPSEYVAAHERIGRVSRRLSRSLLWMDAQPWFRDRVLRAFAADPALFSRLLNTHIQAHAHASFGFVNAVRLGWRLVLSPAAEG